MSQNNYLKLKLLLACTVALSCLITSSGFAQKSLLAQKSPSSKSNRFVFNVTPLKTYKVNWVLKNQDKEVIDLKKKVLKTLHPKVYVVGDRVKVTKMAILQGNPYERECHGSRYYRVIGHKFFFKDYYLRKDLPVKIWVLEAIDLRTHKKVKIKNKEIKFRIK